jgi:integrase
LTLSPRSFLAFLHVDGVLDESLARAAPRVAGWRLAGLPRSLDPGVAQCLLASCDQAAVIGRRDRAMLPLLWRLALRRGEVAAMTLDDLDWRAGQLQVCGKSRRVEVLPLPWVIRSSLRHVVNVTCVPVLVSEATRILSASSTSSLLLLSVIVPTGPRTPGRRAPRRQRPASSECAAYGCPSLAGCRGAWWVRIGRSCSRSSVISRG